MGLFFAIPRVKKSINYLSDEMKKSHLYHHGMALCGVSLCIVVNIGLYTPLYQYFVIVYNAAVFHFCYLECLFECFFKEMFSMLKKSCTFAQR